MAGAPPCIFTFLEPLLQAEQLLRRVCRVPIHVSCPPCQNRLLLGSGIYDHLGSMCSDQGIQDLGYRIQDLRSRLQDLGPRIQDRQTTNASPMQRLFMWELELRFPCSVFACGNYNFNSHGAFLHMRIINSLPMQCCCMWDLEFQFPCSVFACGNYKFNSHVALVYVKGNATGAQINQKEK